MTQVPNFAKLDFADTPVAPADGGAAPWMTPEAIRGEARL